MTLIKPLTKKDVVNWIGSDNTLEEAIDIIWQVATGDYPFWLLNDDIADYKENLDDISPNESREY
jgi:hypothetical protein